MYASFFKPLFDFFFALILFLFTVPVLFILCLLIRIESKGSPIFKQYRIGKNTKSFPMFKLRSMYQDAAKKGPHFTQENDPRITKMGIFVRKTSLDEIPQLLNILCGQMSFIGPRPDVAAQEKDYTPEQWADRHRVRPGITGLAQSRLRSLATHEQRTALDLEYNNNISLLMDLNIIKNTIQIILFRKNVV